MSASLSLLSTCNTQAAGTVFAWGANDAGQSTVPGGLSNIVAVAGGSSHSLGLKANGTVVAWGYNLSGQANVPSDLADAIAISGGANYSLALRSNGTVVAWGNSPVQPAGLTNLIAISAGWYHALGLRADGTVISWGVQSNVPPGISNVVAIAAGNGQSVALKVDGTVVAWGDNSFGKATVAADATNVIAVAAGADHCLALKRNGRITGWGRNDSGQITIPTGLTNVIAVAAGAAHSAALRADGTLIAWGDNTYNQTIVNQGITGYTTVSAGGYHSVAIKGDNFPVVLLSPFSQSVFITKSVTLQVVAAGAAPLSYQWQHYLTNLPSATNSLLTITNFQPTDAGPYRAIIANAYGNATSGTAQLTGVGGQPVILSALTDISVACGDTTNFSVVVDGSGPFAYRWSLNGTPVAGATQSTIVFSNATPAKAGPYTVTVTNAYGSVTTGAVLTVTIQPPSITSPLAATAIEGKPFSYQIRAQHNPLFFGAQYMPPGLTVNTNTGVISGSPLEYGTFGVNISAYNACSSDTRVLILTVTSAIPVITSSLNVAGSEGLTLNYQITATQNPTSYDAQNLPTGLSINRATGQITGAPVYNGNFTSTISASNQYGIGSATLTFNFSPAQIAGITLDNLGFIYRKPYLLDFPFTLRETSSGAGIVTKATSLSVAAFEDFPPLGGGTSMITNPSPYATLPALVVTEVNAGQTLTPNAVQETGIFVSKGSGKVFKCFLVLDFTDSISDPISNGDTNHDGISDAVDNMVKGAQFFVDQQPGAAQIGVYEFHRDDVSPAKVSGLTKNKQALDAAIAGIWTNYVQGFYAGSRCWDAMTAAIADLGAANPDEQHAIVVVTDGLDYSSIATEDSVIKAAQAAQVQIYCVAYGNNPDTNVLGQITAATRGQLYTAINSPDLFQQLALSSKDVQAQYILRWATLRRAPTPFLPDFQLTFQGFSAGPPAWTWQMGQNLATNIDNTTTPPTTNVVTNLFGVWSNPRLGPYDVTNWAGPVTNGTLRIVTDDEVQPTGLTIRATYTPRFIRMMKFHYRANWPCTAILDSTSDYLANWTLSETPDGSGGKWVLLSSSNTVDQSTSLPFGWFGPLFTLKFEDVLLNTSNALSFITVDNSIYTNIPAGGQTFAFETNAVGSTNAFVTAYPPMPHGTPVPWIIQYNLAGAANSNAWALAELADTDGDGVPNWKEYVANTNPTNSASKFFIRNITRLSNGRAQITFTTTINRTYRVEASSDLVNWQTVQDLIPAINADVTITDTRYVPGVIGLFYRVVVY